MGRPVFSIIKRPAAVQSCSGIFVGQVTLDDVSAVALDTAWCVRVLEVIKPCAVRPLLAGTSIIVAQGGHDQRQRMRMTFEATGRTASYPAVRYEHPLRLAPKEPEPHVFMVVPSDNVDFELVADGACEPLGALADIRRLLGTPPA